MKKLMFAIFAFHLALGSALAADKAEKPEPSQKQKAQQERMMDCNAKASDKKGDERKAFMSSCLKGQQASATTPQQEKMKSCNKEASGKHLKGDERKKFMSSCLKG